MITKSNISELQKLIGQVSSMIDWVSNNTQSSKRLSMVKELVNSRRQLKRIYNAMIDNPAIAAYGESQMGKSYIISRLLSSPMHPLKVADDEGNRISFIDNVNQENDGRESTGVITRFTTSKVISNPHYPVKLHLLNLADFIIILADSYMRDISCLPYSEKELSDIYNRLIERYSEEKNCQGVLTEDEVADVEEYLYRYNKNGAGNYINTGFFDVLSSIVRKVPETEWVNLFSALWKNDAVYNKLFSLYVSAYSSMDFSSDVHVSIKAVLNNQDSPTLMCVNALDGLGNLLDLGLKSGTQTEVLLPSGKTVFVNKSLLSVMTAEAIYNIEENVYEDEIAFDFQGIRDGISTRAEQNIDLLKQHGIEKPLKKDFLRFVDLLDFPGARGRDLKFLPANIVAQLNELVLRSKVSYLFNKYSEELKLSILMLCHNHKNSTPNLIPPILNSWVKTYIGEDPQQRQACLINYDVPPLFLVSTMYNCDLAFEREKDTGSIKDLNVHIFKGRLHDVLYEQVIKGEVNFWFKQWVPGQSFDNTFLLRDYYYSSGEAKGSAKLFMGFPGPEKDEYDADERAKLKRIFLEDDAVKRFFSNPEIAWDVASTVGNDGAYYMLKKLANVSMRATKARDLKFNEDIRKIADNVTNLMRTEFHDDNDSELLEQSIRSARKFHFMLLRACEKQSDFFGRMVQFLQLNSNYVATYFSKLIHSIAIVAPTDVKEYEMLVRGIEEQGLQFDPSPTEAAYKANFKILDDVYGISGPDDPALRGIDPIALFQSTYKKRCTPSTVLANALVETWSENLLKPESSVIFTQAGFDGMVFSNFISNFTNMMVKINLAQRIADAIKEYVDYSAAIAPQNEELIADIATNIYNSFVMNLGYNFLDAEMRDKVDVFSDKFKLPKVVLEEELYQPILSDDEQLGLLFNQIESLNEGEGGQLTQLPAYVSMRRWMSYVFMSFTVAYDVANYDEVANKMLGEILSDLAESKKKLA